VVLDNAHRKFLARYAVNPQVPTRLAEQVLGHLTEPDLVFFLDIDAREALVRKGSFISLEASHAGGSDEDFIRYQDSVLDQMRDQATRGRRLRLGFAEMDRDQVFKAASAALADRLHLPL
jgi:dTMP kinase